MSPRRAAVPERCYVVAGGTLVHVAPHFALCAPAYGRVGRELAKRLSALARERAKGAWTVQLLLTRMASGGEPPPAGQAELLAAAGLERLETNADLARLIAHLVADPETRGLVLAAAVCDFEPTLLRGADGERRAFGKGTTRLRTSDGDLSLDLSPADKIVRAVRQERKDIFLVSFKTTAGAERRETYRAGLRSLKRSSSNLVLANDVQTLHNVVVTPEEFPYYAEDRGAALDTLARMITARSSLSFVRTRLRPGERADPRALAEAGAIPANFLPVLEQLLARGAYKPLDGKTAGHFGCKVEGRPFRAIASCRKEDHNQVLERGLAKIYRAEGGIEAEGAKPSVGEHTQQRIYEELGDAVHSIVHFHCPRRPGAEVPVRPQFAFECGSVECSHNTASGLAELAPGVFAVHLEGHGPNVAFHRDVAAADVIAFIEARWDLDDKSGGLV